MHFFFVLSVAFSLSKIYLFSKFYEFWHSLLLVFRDEKEPLREEKKITPIIDSGLRRETSITFDGKRSISKTGFVGKDSAV